MFFQKRDWKDFNLNCKCFHLHSNRFAGRTNLNDHVVENIEDTATRITVRATWKNFVEHDLRREWTWNDWNALKFNCVAIDCRPIILDESGDSCSRSSSPLAGLQGKSIGAAQVIQSAFCFQDQFFEPLLGCRRDFRLQVSLGFFDSRYFASLISHSLPVQPLLTRKRVLYTQSIFHRQPVAAAFNTRIHTHTHSRIASKLYRGFGLTQDAPLFLVIS